MDNNAIRAAAYRITHDLVTPASQLAKDITPVPAPVRKTCDGTHYIAHDFDGSSSDYPCTGIAVAYVVTEHTGDADCWCQAYDEVGGPATSPCNPEIYTTGTHHGAPWRQQTYLCNTHAVEHIDLVAEGHPYYYGTFVRLTPGNDTH